MRIGATDAERADAGAARRIATGPRRHRGIDHEWRTGKGDRRVWRLEMQARGNAVPLQRQRGLDHAGRAGRDHQVADIALDRADPAEADIIGMAAERLGQPLDLDRVAERRGGAVRLHVIDAARIDARIVERHRDQRRLSFAAWRGEAGLVGTVVVDRAAADHRHYLVAVGDGVGQALEQHHRRAIAEHRALRIGVEAAGVAVGRQHRALLVVVAAGGRACHRSAASQRHVAAAGTQAVDGLADRHQRGGATGVHADRRAGEVELVRDTGGDVILLVAEHHLERADLVDQVRVPGNVALEIGRVVHAGEDADRPLRFTRRVAATLHAFPAQLEEDALLRIHQLGFARPDAEERGIEQFDVVDHAARGNVVRIGAFFRRHRRIQRVGVEVADGVACFAEVLPERLDIGSAGEAAGHGDDRDRVVADGTPLAPVATGDARAVDAAFVALAQHHRQRCRRWLREDRGDGHGAAMLRHPADAFGQLHRQQRTAAEFEEIVMAADAIDVEQFGAGAADRAFQRIDGWLVGRGEFRTPTLRCRQRAAVQLAVAGDRHRIEPHVTRWHHEIGQRRRHEGTQLRRRRRHVVRHVVGDELLAAGAVGPRQHDAGLHAGMPGQCRLDLARFDAEAADLDLMIGAADELDAAIAETAHAVAGAIQALARRTERVRHEPLSGQVGATQVTACQSLAADVQLADRAHRQRLAARVEDVDLGVGDGAADRDRGRARRHHVRDAMGAGEGRALGRAVAVVQGDTRGGFAHAPDVPDRQRFATGEQRLQAGQLPRVLVDHGIEQRRGQPCGGHAVATDRRREPGAGRQFLVVHDDTAAVEQCTPQFQRRGVEAQRRGMQHPRLRAEFDVVDIADQAQDRAMADLDALRRAGRARGVHDIGQRVTVDSGLVGRRGRMRFDGFRRGANDDPRQRAFRQESTGFGVDHHHARRGIVEHEGQPFGRLRWIQWQVRGTSLQRRHHRDDGLRRTLHRDADHVAGHDTRCAQPCSKLRRAAVEFAIRERARGIDQRQCVRVAVADRGEAAVHGVAQ